MWNHLKIIKQWYFAIHISQKQAILYDLDIDTIWKQPIVSWNLCILAQIILEDWNVPSFVWKQQ